MDLARDEYHNFMTKTLFLLLGFLISVPYFGFSNCLDGCEPVKFSYQTESLEINLRRIYEELGVNIKAEQQLFNELQLIRFNNRLGSIQKKKISTLSVYEEDKEVTVQSYPSGERLRLAEARAANVKSKIFELRESAIQLEKEIRRINQLRGPFKEMSSDALESGFLINILDSQGGVLGSKFCDDGRCDTAKKFAVNIPRGGIYYLQVVSGSSERAPVGRYKLETVGLTKQITVALNQSSVPKIVVGEMVSGSVESKEQVDEYSINLKRTGRSQLKMFSEVASATGWTFQVLDSGGDELKRFICSATECKSGTDYWLDIESAGSYSVLVSSGSKHSTPTGDYFFQFVYESSEALEAEPNDVEAQKISIGSSVIGNISSVDDLDLFAIDVEQPGTLSVSAELLSN